MPRRLRLSTRAALFDFSKYRSIFGQMMWIHSVERLRRLPHWWSRVPCQPCRSEKPSNWLSLEILSQAECERSRRWLTWKFAIPHSINLKKSRVHSRVNFPESFCWKRSSRGRRSRSRCRGCQLLAGRRLLRRRCWVAAWSPESSSAAERSLELLTSPAGTTEGGWCQRNFDKTLSTLCDYLRTVPTSKRRSGRSSAFDSWLKTVKTRSLIDLFDTEWLVTHSDASEVLHFEINWISLRIWTLQVKHWNLNELKLAKIAANGARLVREVWWENFVRPYN